MRPALSFQERARAWMASYRLQALGVAEAGTWSGNGRQYPHVLPAARRDLNILPAFREEFWEWFRGQTIRLHGDFHHLNSSQAMCFNLFFPLLRAGAWDTALEALGIGGSPAPGASFEYQPSYDEGTCFDFMLPLRSGARVYFELKYAETEFGRARADAAHYEKLEAVYRPRMMARFRPKYREPGMFFAHYQILRNIWHMEPGDFAVFLFPKANERLRRQEAAILDCALEPFASQVRIAYLEDVTAALGEQSREFSAKYLPAEVTPAPEGSSLREKLRRAIEVLPESSLPETLKLLTNLRAPAVRMDHAAAWVEDLERARAFYERWFQADAGPLYSSATRPFRSCLMTFASGARLELMAAPQEAARPAHIALTVGTPSAVDDLAARMKAEGVAVVSGPRRTGDGAYEAAALDSEGNLIEMVAEETVA
jgi:predicted enzyme related to lactoylglutathione lyase